MSMCLHPRVSHKNESLSRTAYLPFKKKKKIMGIKQLWMILLGLVFFFFCKFNSTGWVSFIWNLKSSKIWNFLEHWHYATNGKFQLAVERFPDVAQVPAYPDSCDMCQRVGLWCSVGAILLTVITTKPMCIVRYDYRVFCAHTLLCGANVLLKMSKRPANTLMGNKKSICWRNWTAV